MNDGSAKSHGSIIFVFVHLYGNCNINYNYATSDG